MLPHSPCPHVFDEQEFLDDHVNVPWQNVEAHTNIDEAYQQWKSLFMDVCDTHCPIVGVWEKHSLYRFMQK